jgi:ZIP family zinc transporter
MGVTYMNELVKITAIGLFVGVVGTGAGGLLAVRSDNFSKRLTSAALEFSAGMMLAVLALDLLPAAFATHGVKISLLGVVLGIAFTVILQDIIKYRSHRFSSRSMIGSGVLLFFAVALHNLPEGLAIGASYMTASGLCLSIAITIMLHNIPEGVAIAIPLRKGGYSKARMVFIVALAGAPIGLGAFLGGLFGEIASWAVSFCLAFAAGAMLYISVGDIMTESREIYKGRFSYVANVVGFVFGLIITQAVS